MQEKLIDVLREQPYFVPSLLLKKYRSFKISDQECILLIYLLNSSSSFNPKAIASELSFSLEEVMNDITSLTEKGILKVDLVTKKVREEIINLDGLYQKLSFSIINEETEETKNNLFTIFEKEFGRTLSPIDYEIIMDWQKEFSDDLILLALKEAVFNGVSNLRYIDKIIRDWHKKGIKNEADVVKEKKNYQAKKSDKKLFDYDWLNERDN